MNIQTQAVRHEEKRIAGACVDTDERVNVVNPYTNKVNRHSSRCASRARAGLLSQRPRPLNPN